MSFAEYARHLGVSKPAVTYAVRDGRISTTRDHAGKLRINSDTADVEWYQNTAHEKKRNTADQTPGQAPPDPPPPRKLIIEKTPDGDQIAFTPQELLLPDKPDLEANGTDKSYASARAIKEHYAAKQAELDFLESSGRMVDVSTIQKEWTSVAASVRTKVLGIPSKAKQRIPDLTHEQFLAIEKLVRESLEDLVNEADNAGA
ncbi:MAG: hypothetical protein ACXWQE_00130 [Bdellovibrionales bacterium]